MTFSISFWELCSAKCTRLDGCLAEKPSSKTFSAFIFSWLASSVRSLCTLGRPPPPQLPHKTPRQLSSNSGYRVKFKPGLCPLSFLTFSGNCLFNLHPWKWFEGYPVKSTPFFREGTFPSQIHLTFSNPSQLLCNSSMLLKSFSKRKPSQCLLKSKCWKIFNLLKWKYLLSSFSNGV